MRMLGRFSAAGFLIAVLCGATIAATGVQAGNSDAQFTIAAAHQSEITKVEKQATLEDIKVASHTGETRITISISPAVMPVISALADPTRLVLDFTGTTSLLPYQRMRVNQDGLSAIRVGIQPGEPPTTRVVLDLREGRTHELKTEGNKVVLTLGAREDAAAFTEGSDAPAAKVNETATAAPGAADLATPAAASASTAGNTE